MVAKNVAIISVCSLVLVAAVVGGMVAVLHYHNNDNQVSTSTAHSNDINASKKAIHDMCQSTQYKQTCIRSISKATNSSDPKEVMKMCFKVAMKEVGEVMKKSKVLQQAAKDPNTSLAYKTCENLLNDSIEDIQRSFVRMESFDFSGLGMFVDDLKTWLTGAMTFQDNCLDLFEDTKGNAGENMKKLLRQSIELTSNGLAMVTEFSKLLLPSKTTKSPKRRLLINIPLPHADDIDYAIGYTSGPRSRVRRMLLAAQMIKPDIVVAQDGSGQYKTINEALKNVVTKPTGDMFVIHIKAGVYKEYVVIPKKMKSVMFIGDGPTQTTITGSRTHAQMGKTMLSATFSVEGDYFMAKDIGFENTAGVEGHQAVALRVSADESIFYNCRIDGYQDTLMVQNHRQFYRDCTITGTVDFIFGNARAILQNCTLIIKKPGPNQECMVTAQGRHDQNQVSALILQNCKITMEQDYPLNDKHIKSFLGRPWKNFSRTIVMHSEIDQVIDPKGWAPWINEKNIMQYMDTCSFIEFENTGPGADKSKRVTWPGIRKITKEQAEELTPAKYMQGDAWIPTKHIPYSPGFMKS